MPFYRTTFCVTSQGRNGFPLDMLRYDACYPEHSSDVVAVAKALDGREGIYYINLVHAGPDRDWRPNARRWETFDWRVMGPTEVEAMGRNSGTTKVPS